MFTKDNGSVARRKSKRKHEILGTVIKVKGRTVGQVIGDTFVKDITNRHMLKEPEAIANDIQALHDAERAGAVYCVFTNTDTGIVYRAPIAKIWDMGKTFNWGHGDQIYLTLRNWQQTRNPEYTEPTHTDTPEYSETGTTDTKPLTYESRATIGVVWNGEKQLTFDGFLKGKE